MATLILMSLTITFTPTLVHIDHLGAAGILAVFPRDFALRVLLGLIPAGDGCLLHDVANGDDANDDVVNGDDANGDVGNGDDANGD